MKLITKNSVTHIDVDKVVSGGTRTGKVTMETGTIKIVVINGNMTVEVAFKYTDDNGKELPNTRNGVFKLDDTASVKSISQSINGSIPSTDNIVDRINEEVKAIGTIEMANSFSVEISKIEEVV